MKRTSHFSSEKNRKGMALIMVLSILALATVLLLGLFSVSEADYKGTRNFEAGQNARALADTAVDVVIAQLQNGARQQGNTRTFHATQPGAVRKYNASGAFLAGYKLYSDPQMVVTNTGAAGEALMVNSAPPDDWNSDANKNRFVDLNEPVIRPSRAGTGVLEVYYPIIDPRAALDQSATNGPPAVEGFSYTKKAIGQTSMAGVVGVDETNDPSQLRLPMPVQWLYVLRDGSLGHMSESGKIVMADGQASPSVENPIVGRIAFWTDDEACKVNINTASEPTEWAIPSVFHEREWRFAEYPPAMHEYQRFPGHPATVALSSILYPNQNMDIFTPGLDSAGRERIKNIKERIYEIIPKINIGGSKGGTVPFGAENFGEDTAMAVDVMASKSERLFASVDELLFSMGAQTNKRSENDFVIDGVKLLDANTLERSRFFLTAHSRGSDVNFMGLPKVTMWPVADESKGEDYRTGFDKMIAFCSTLSASGKGVSNSYYFRRKEAHSNKVDINITRNRELMDYLNRLMKKTFPAGATGNGQSFDTKYGLDAPQILLTIFDYIRTINLYDSMLSKQPEELWNLTSYGGANRSSDYKWWYINRPNDFKTYTEDRFKTTRTGTEIETDEVFNGSFPGHGAVTPSEWSPSGAGASTTYRGIGRFPTISEVALHFICTADGNNDVGSYGIPQADPVNSGQWIAPAATAANLANPNLFSGGKTAKRYMIDAMRADHKVVDPSHAYTDDDSAREKVNNAFLGERKAVWYSNYAPYPPTGGGGPFGKPPLYGASNTAPTSSPIHLSNHPGYDPENWNATLESGKPLQPGEKRIQACLHLESFVPALGWTKVHPEMTYVLDGNYINQIQVVNSEGKTVSLFSTTQDCPVKSMANMYDGHSSHPVGGVSNFRSFALGKHVKGSGNMQADPNYFVGVSDQPHEDIHNMDLVSSFVTVKGSNFQLIFPNGPLTIRVYDTHDWKKADPVQIIKVKFPSGAAHMVKTPELVTYTSLKDTWVSSGTTYNQRITDATRWWAFNFAGAMRRFTGTWNNVKIRPREAYTSSSHADYAQVLRNCGRLRLYDHSNNDGNSAIGAVGTKGRSIPQTNAFIWGFDPGSGAYRGINPTERNPSAHIDDWGTDVVRSVMIRHGDYRIVAARKEVTEDFWIPNPLWGSDPNATFAHNLSAHHATAEPGAHRGGNVAYGTDNKFRLIYNANYRAEHIPDMPLNNEATAAANAYGDFDNGVGTARDGAYINKPDEGNLSQLQKNFGGTKTKVRNAYYLDSQYQAAATEAYFTPNRMVSSPVMFGSIPTGVWGSRPVASIHPDAAKIGVPWRTLLFRPQVKYPNVPNSQSAHPGSSIHANATGATPADHYLLELFRMPVVEPYAISDQFSTAGKINLNYQIVPFTNIKRATALHAMMKGELMRTIPKTDVQQYKNWRASSSTDWESYKMHSETEGTARYWHRKIDVEKTLTQFDERFNLTASKTGVRGLLRTASQLCEMHLIPARTASSGDATLLPTTIDQSNRETVMAKFWDAHSLSGDNSREAPYSNLYARATTQSNVFKVHMKVQTIQKARSSAADEFNPQFDSVVGEYRGATVIERYIEPNDVERPLPDYASEQDPFAARPIPEYYRFRVLENKRFVP